jgi:phosphoribosylglycinamide formyltransferase-1
VSSETKFNLAILASGGGSNAEKICTYFSAHPSIQVGLVICNRKAAGVFHVAAENNIESVYLPKDKWSEVNEVLALLKNRNISHIVLAGFLLHIPEALIKAYPGRIINIHPSLLPRHGGKGMYGHHVHEAVKNAGERISGMTIHEVNAHYDEGRIIFQKEVALSEADTPEDIASKVLKLEHAHYSKVIEKWILAKEDDPEIEI